MRQVTETMNDNNAVDARRRFLLDLASSTVLGLKDAASNNNVRQVADFVNGMIFTGLLIEKNTPDEGSPARFLETYQRDASQFRADIEAGRFTDADAVKASMATHRIGVTDQSPSEMLITLGMSAENVIREIGDEYGLSKEERLQVVTFGVVLAAVANTRAESVDAVMASLDRGISEKVQVWDRLIPSDDEWIGEEE
jgi:hypothetical protein